jgi:hypothetical protein
MAMELRGFYGSDESKKKKRSQVAIKIRLVLLGC